MNKFFAAMMILPSLAFACPTLEGTYPHCHSEIKQMKGAYTVDQKEENGVEVYSIKYTDENGNVEEDQFRTDGSKVSRKHEIPTVGVKVRVDANAVCDKDSVVSKGKAYFLGANVGNYDSTIYKTNEGILTMEIDAQYLGKTVHKLIQCKE